MDAEVIVAVSFLSVLAATGWANVIRTRPLRARLWSLVRRDPRMNQRGYAIRIWLSSLETIRFVTAAGTVMFLWALLMYYLVDVRGWQGPIPLAVLIVVIFSALIIAAIKSDRTAHRVGLTCPSCKAQLGDPPRQPGLFLRSGRCAVCETVVFEVPDASRIRTIRLVRRVE